MKYNNKIAQISGLITALAKEIQLDEEITRADKYFAIQEILQAIAPAEKFIYSTIKKSIEKEAKENLLNGDIIEKDGFRITCKWSKPPIKTDYETIAQHYSQLLADYNQEFNNEDYQSVGTTSKKVIIEKI